MARKIHLCLLIVLGITPYAFGQSVSEPLVHATDPTAASDHLLVNYESFSHSALMERLNVAETEVDRLRKSIEHDGLIDVGNHFHLANHSRFNYQQDGGGGAGGGGGGDAAAQATEAQNPVGNLWMLWFQNDMKLLEGPGDGKRIFNSTVLQPVMPVPLTDRWRVINRPVIPLFNANEVPAAGFQFNPANTYAPITGNPTFETRAGIGDIIFAQFYSASAEGSKFVWGIGETWMIPTATDDALGTGKLSVGPAALGMWMGDKMIIGAIMQQWFSVGGSDSRERVSTMDIQYVARYRLNPMASIGAAPNIQWNQVTGKWTVPVGLGLDVVAPWKRGNCKPPLPIRMGAELYYYVSHQDRAFDNEWAFRLFFVPIIPSPGWAQKPLFGGGHGHCRNCR